MFWVDIIDLNNRPQKCISAESKLTTDSLRLPMKLIKSAIVFPPVSFHVDSQLVKMSRWKQDCQDF